MPGELLPDDPKFPFDAQYRMVAWRATFKTFELVSTSKPIFKEVPFAPPHVFRALSGCAIKETIDIIEETKRNKTEPLHSDLLSLGIMLDHKNPKINTDLARMAFFYTTHDEESRKTAECYNIARFDDDIKFLAISNLDRLRTAQEANRLSADETLELMVRIRHENDLFIGMQDRDRQLGSERI